MDLSNNIVQSGVEGIGKVKKGKFALIGTFSICFRVSCNVCLECIKYATVCLPDKGNIFPLFFHQPLCC